MELKKVLLLCDAFPPAFAPRMGYLCKYLRSLGWDPFIITEQIDKNIDPILAQGQSVKYVKIYHFKKRYLAKLEWIIILIVDFFFNYKDFLFCKIAQQEINKDNYSLILTSSFKTFPIYAAYKISRKNHLPLVVDLRDIIEQYTGYEYIDHQLTKINFFNQLILFFFKKKNFRQRNKVLKKADYITTISEWHADLLKQYNRNVKLIYNGYDPDLFYFQAKPTNQFRITYTGRIISLAMRNPAILFESVVTLVSQKSVNPEQFRIQFYTDDRSKEFIHQLAQKYKIEEFIDYYEYVLFSEIPIILKESSILLLLTNQSSGNGPKGIMTTKFFEYLAVEKPILCIRNDNGCLKRSIQKTQSGIAADTADEVSGFILEKYTEWQEKSYTHQEINKSCTEEFSRKYQAKEFVAIFDSIIKKT